jgi:hypothetical protein
MMSENNIQIHCKYDELLPVTQFKVNPLNPNCHEPDQVKRLAKLYQHHGVRHPIIVSRLSGMIVAGHGRLDAAIESGMDTFPVVYQDFDSSDSEYLFMVSDNAIQQDWADMDLKMISATIGDIGPFDIELLGFQDFKVDAAEIDDGQNDEKEPSTITCPECGHTFIKK